MIVKKVELIGFKRFDHLTLDLGPNPKRIVALVGPNGSGKSSVFDGFLFLQNHHEVIGQFGPKDALYYSKDQQANYRDSFREKVKVEFDSGNFSEVINNKRQTGDQKTMFSFRSSHRYSQNLNVTTLSTLPSIKENNIGASHSVDLDEKITQNYQRLYAYLDSYMKQKDLTHKQAIGQVLGDLNTILGRCLDIQIADIGEIISGRGRLYFTKPGQAKSFDYNYLSSGEKEVVDILLDTFLKAESYTDSIYCIDEPELHLNTSIQKKLLIEIEKLIPANCQLWVATHSIGFLRALQDELSNKSQVLDFSEKDYFTGPQTIEPISTTRSNWQRIFQTALEDLTGLLAPEVIVYCEGTPQPGASNEELGLDAEVYNQIFSEKYPNSLFVSSGGGDATKNASLALNILNKAFTSSKLLLLKDRDGISDTDRTTFLNQDPSNRMLERNEIENYLFDIEVLKKYCEENSLTFNEQRYLRAVTDIKDQDLKPVQQEIQHSCHHKGQIKDFKIGLATYISQDMGVYKELGKLIFT